MRIFMMISPTFKSSHRMKIHPHVIPAQAGIQPRIE
jgi:hypothetical protein